MKKVLINLKNKAGLGYAALFALMVSMFTPALAHADAISDAVKDFDTTNILAAGAAIIGLVLAVVGIKYVIRLLKGA